MRYFSLLPVLFVSCVFIYGKAQGQSQLSIPELRNIAAKEYLKFKEEVWLGNYGHAYKIFEANLSVPDDVALKESFVAYLRRLDSVNFSLVALDSKNPGKIQEALAGPKLATAARHPNLNMKLMQWALLEWEAGDKDRSLLILESWPRQPRLVVPTMNDVDRFWVYHPCGNFFLCFAICCGFSKMSPQYLDSGCAKMCKTIIWRDSQR